MMSRNKRSTRRTSIERRAAPSFERHLYVDVNAVGVEINNGRVLLAFGQRFRTKVLNAWIVELSVEDLEVFNKQHTGVLDSFQVDDGLSIPEMRKLGLQELDDCPSVIYHHANFAQTAMANTSAQIHWYWVDCHALVERQKKIGPSPHKVKFEVPAVPVVGMKLDGLSLKLLLTLAISVSPTSTL